MIDELLNAAHQLVLRQLGIPASPPAYNGIVADVATLLELAFGVAASDLAGAAAADIAIIAAGLDDTVGDHPVSRWAAAKKRVGELQVALAAVGQDLSPQDTLRFGRYLAAAYRLGQTEVTGALGWEVGWTVADRDAVAGLYRSGLFWVGNHYGEALNQQGLLDAVRDVVLEQGLSYAVAGERLQALFGAQLQRSTSYWTGLAATVTTRARSFGAISEMEQLGVVQYEYVNPDDERTSDVCRRLNGTLFTVKAAAAKRDSLLDEVETPAEWVAANPWPKVTQLTTDGTADGPLRPPAELTAAGIAWPPLHFRCRSAIDVAVWSVFGAGEVDPLADVDPTASKPPKTAPPPQPLPAPPPAPVLPPPWAPTLPSQLETGPWALTVHDWNHLLAMMGYDEDEIAGVLKAKLAGGKAMVAAIAGGGDFEAIKAWLAAHPPAAPRTWSVQLIPPADVWEKWKVATATGKGEIAARDAVEYYLSGLGYAPEEIEEALVLLKGQAVSPSSWLQPGMGVGRWVRVLDDHPPGLVLGQYDPVYDPPPLPKKPPPPPPKAPPPPAAPAAPVPPPLTAGAVPATASDGAVGAVAAPGSYAWVPDTPPLKVAGVKSGKTWAAWLQGQGYSAAEVEQLWPDLLAALGPTPSTAAGLEKHALTKAKALAWGPKAVAHLSAHPPGKAAGASLAPPLALSPAELGARLQLQANNRYRDVLTGQDWFIEALEEDHARLVITSTHLLKALDIEVPDHRLVEMGGALRLARRRVKGWEEADLEDLQEHAAALAAQAPAEAWLGMTQLPEMMVRRAPSIDGAVLRPRPYGVLGREADGATTPLSVSDFRELDDMVRTGWRVYGDATGDPTIFLPMLDRIGGLDDSALEAAVSAGGGTAAHREQLLGVLRTRRHLARERAALIREQFDARPPPPAQGEVPFQGVRLTELGDRPPNGATWTMAGDHFYVRGQEITVNRYRLVKGKDTVHEGFEARLILDDVTVGPAVAKRLEALGGQPGEFRSWKRLGFGTPDDTAGSPEIRYDAEQESGFLSQWEGGAVRHSTPLYDIELAGAETPTALQYRMRIQIRTADPALAQQRLAEVFSELGIAGTMQAPTAEFRRLMKANRALWNIEGGKFKATLDADEAEARLDQLGIDPETIEMREIGGHQVPVLPGRGRRYMDDDKVLALKHTYGGAQAIPSLCGVDNAGGGLLSTIERTNRGIVVSGWSSDEDLDSGGASYVFTRLVGSASATHGLSSRNVLISPDILDRLDWFGYNTDRYGNTSDAAFRNRMGADALISRLSKHGHSDNEVMIADTIPPDYFIVMPVGTLSVQRESVAQLARFGITEIRGRPAAEFFPLMEHTGDRRFLVADNPWHAYLMGEGELPEPAPLVE